MEPVELAALVHRYGERVDRADDGLAVKVYRAVQDAAHRGTLGPGETLPSSRAAATALRLSRNTVNAAYDLLRAEGVLETSQGRRPRLRQVDRVEPFAAAPSSPSLSRRGHVLSIDPRAGRPGPETGLLTPGIPDPTLFPADQWAQALRRVARRPPDATASYGDYQGLPALQAAIADQLARHRGLRIDRRQVLVLPGMQAALSLLAQSVADPGDLAAVEDPGYAGARAAFSGAGLHLIGMPVDDEGVRITPGIASARLIYVTPSTQYPTGVRLSLPRRQSLLRAAHDYGALIIEDDYDSEFVWRGREIPALHALAGGEGVVYLGTAAKSLLPGLRLAWLIAPPGLIAPLAQAQRNLGLAANVHAQAALAEFLTGGAYRAHLRRISRAYAKRRALLASALQSHFRDSVNLSSPDGGLQLVAEFKTTREEDPVLDRLSQAGFGVAGLSGYCIGPPRFGLVLGFADATEPRVRRLCTVLSQALHGARPITPSSPFGADARRRSWTRSPA